MQEEIKKNIHLGKPRRERETLVSGEGEHLASARRQRCDVTGVDEEKQENVEEQR